MTNVKSLLARTAIGAVLASAFIMPATAQVTEEKEARLSTVTVSAQRLEEDLQDVPVSITKLADEKLAVLSSGGPDIRFLSARVPSVIAESSFGRAFPRFYIRGIGNTDFDLNASQPVSLVYDDVPYESPILKGFPVFDLEGIEVLRGPQGTLFGRNTPGGIIRFDSKKPTDELDAYASGSYASYNTVELQGAVGGPLANGVSGRISGFYQTRDDYVDDTNQGIEDAYEGFEEFAGRAQLLVAPEGSDFSALLNLHARSNDGTARLFRANIMTKGEAGLNENFDRDSVALDGLNYLTQDTHGVTLTMEKGIGTDWTLKYIFGFENAEIESRGDIDGGFGAVFAPPFGPGFIPFPSETSGAVDYLDQYTNEILASWDNGGPLSATFGVFLFDEKVDISSKNFSSLAPGNPQDGATAQRSLDTDSTGIFASLSYDVSEDLTLSGGARWTDDEKNFVSGSDDRTLGDEQVSWDVSAVYSLSDTSNIYARIAKGFRGPTVQQRFGAPSQADSETVLSYEAGFKSEFLDNRVRLNTSAYMYEFEGQQLTIVGGLDNSVSLFNADKSEGYGFEVDLEALLTENFVVTTGLSYNHTEFKDDVIVAPGCGLIDPDGDGVSEPLCTILDPAVYDEDDNFLGYNISGNSFPNAPEWIANITARYAYPIEGGELFAFTDWAYKGDTNFFLYESVEFGQEGYWEGGLRLGYKSERGYEAAVFARNILDEEVLEGGIDFNNLLGFVNEPRIIGVQLSWNH